MSNLDGKWGPDLGWNHKRLPPQFTQTMVDHMKSVHPLVQPTSKSHQDYHDLLESTFANIRELSRLKGGEYAGDHDRLANFRRNGKALNLQMEQVWAVYAAKHWDAVMQYINDLGTNKVRERMEPIEGRIDDLLVYLCLFKLMLKERADVGLVSK